MYYYRSYCNEIAREMFLKVETLWLHFQTSEAFLIANSFS